MSRLGAFARSTLYYLGAVVLFLAGWELVASMKINGRDMLPSLADVSQAFKVLNLEGQLLHDIAVSLVRFHLGWFIGAALAIPCGLFTGRQTAGIPAPVGAVVPWSESPIRRH